MVDSMYEGWPGELIEIVGIVSASLNVNETEVGDPNKAPLALLIEIVTGMSPVIEELCIVPRVKFFVIAIVEKFTVVGRTNTFDG